MKKPISRLVTLQAITFLHPGTGQSTGAVDLPVQREVHTEFPMYSSSGFKGSLRDKAEQLWGAKDDKVISTFGATTDDNQDSPSAGAIAITDARILAFPVRSLQQVFQWITCPMIIKRLIRDAKLVGHPAPEISIPELNSEMALVCKDTNYSSPLVLEEIAYTIEANEKANKIADFIESTLSETSGFDKDRLLIISDEDFKYHVKYSTQISARIKLNDRKTTTGDGGNLWYEETLPPETLLYGFILCHKPRNNSATLKHAQDTVNCVQEICEDGYLQIGGNETVGQGWCSLTLTPNEEIHI